MVGVIFSQNKRVDGLLLSLKGFFNHEYLLNNGCEMGLKVGIFKWF